MGGNDRTSKKWSNGTAGGGGDGDGWGGGEDLNLLLLEVKLDEREEMLLATVKLQLESEHATQQH